MNASYPPSTQTPQISHRFGPPLIAKAAVIGAGAMGAGIAAQFANAGIPVVLFDLPGADPADPAAVARAGIASQLRAGGFMRADLAALVTPAALDQDLGLIADADWIVEAVVERLDVKQDLFRRLQAARKPGSIVSSNTSTLLRKRMVEGASDAFARDFLITHFFNPPRHMQLVELISDPSVDPALEARAAAACEQILGKTVVLARDTPGFIANRIGCYWMAMATLEALDAGLDIETADRVLALVAATPKTGVFGLFDLVGLDLIPTVWNGLHQVLPPEDALQRHDLRKSPVVQALLAAKHFGRKTKAGFYRLTADRKREAWDPGSAAYRPERTSSELKSAATALDILERSDAIGRFARRVVVQTVAYAAEVGPHIADTAEAVDTAMRLGYAWDLGPFALGQRYGQERLGQWAAREGLAPPKETGEFASFTAPQASANPPLGGGLKATDVLFESPAASLRDLGDDVACLELRTKLNILTVDVFNAMAQAINLAEGRLRGLVITGAGTRAFCAGASLSSFLEMIDADDVAGLETFVDLGQTTLQALKYAPFPVVSAAFGVALGGGCEVMLHSDAIVAHAELNAGLPEINVGLVPGWGGCTQSLLRAQADGLSPEAACARAFDLIFGAQVSSSAMEAAARSILRSSDVIVMNRNHLLHEAKAAVVRLSAQGYRPPTRPSLTAGGDKARNQVLAALSDRDDLSSYDRFLADQLLSVLSGGASGGQVTEEDLLAKEREVILSLAQHSQTRERIAAMLATGKPLKN